MEFVKYVPIDSNTTVWEIGAMLDKGKELYLHMEDTKLPMRVYGCAIQYRHSGVWCGLTISLAGWIKQGNIYSKVQVPWQDTLDGTVEKGVWCTVSSNNYYDYIELVTGFKPNNNYKYVSTTISTSNDAVNKDTITCNYKKATPVPKTLSDELDKLYSIKRDNNDDIESEYKDSVNVNCHIQV